MTAPEKGFAIVEDGRINIRSVTATERGAKVNFLCTDRGCMVPNGLSDQQIQNAWELYRNGAECVAIVVVDAQGSA